MSGPRVRRGKVATRDKVALSLPKDLLASARSAVASGSAESLSAFVSDAIQRKLRADTFEAILDSWDQEYGPPSPEAEAWARQVLGL
jgi:hypothetical protein